MAQGYTLIQTTCGSTPCEKPSFAQLDMQSLVEIVSPRPQPTVSVTGEIAHR